MHHIPVLGREDTRFDQVRGSSSYSSSTIRPPSNKTGSAMEAILSVQPLKYKAFVYMPKVLNPENLLRHLNSQICKDIW